MSFFPVNLKVRFYLFLTSLFFSCLPSIQLTAQTYCVPTITGNTGQGITRFRLDVIDHSSPAGEGMRDTILTKAAGVATVVNGQTIQALVDLPLPATITVWIDYNHDGNFNSAQGDVVGEFNGISGTNAINLNIGTINVVNGITRLRIFAGSIGMSEQACLNGVPNGDCEDYLVNITTYEMQCDSVVVTQVQPCCMYAGKVRKEIIGVEISTSNKLNPLTLKDFIFSTAGTTNMGDITKAELWYIGTSQANNAPPTYFSPNLSNRVLFGSLNNPAAPTFTISGSMILEPKPAGVTTHYFLLSYDISASATTGNTIDAGCLEVKIDSSSINLSKTPLITNVPGLYTLETPTSYVPSNRANVWYFGENAGLDFNCSPPKATADNRMSSSETAATISDPQGKLLFYTNGERVWNANHEIMTNGTGLKGHYLVSSGAIIIPDPGNVNEYYIFTSKQSYDSLFYSKVDMTQSTGLGAITSKNIFVAGGVNIQEIKAAVHHCNGKDIWLATLKKAGGMNFRLRANLITATGIKPAIVNTTYTFSGNNTYPGTQAFSPNGLKFAFPNSETNGLKGVYVVDFDNSSGDFCDTLKIVMDGLIASLAFSSDNSKLYITAGDGLTKYIYQFDMNAGSKNAIRASKTLIVTLNQVYISAMQIGPDKKIYISQIGNNINSEVLHVIDQPNASGAACNFQSNAIGLASRRAANQSNFPKFIDSYFLDPNYIAPSIEAIFSADNASCDGDTITFNNTSISTGHDCKEISYNWDFGDPGSGVNNTSTLANPLHAFSAPGDYTVSLFINERCQYDTAQQQITIYPKANANISGQTTLCTNDSTSLTASGGTSFLWSTGATTAAIDIKPTASSIYSLTVSNGVCFDTTSQNVIVNSAPIAFINGNDTICSGISSTLIASGGGNYLWSSGATTSSITVSPTIQTAYTLTVSIGSCLDSTTHLLTVNPMPSISILPPITTSLCEGDSITLTVSGGSNYNWNTGASTAAITVYPAATTSYSVVSTISSCSDTAEIYINVTSMPQANAGADTTVCDGESITLNGSGGTSYLWSTGASTSQTSISPVSDSTFTLIAYNGSCSDTDYVSVSVAPIPTITSSPDMDVLAGSSVTLSVSTITGATYSWQPPTGLSCNACPDPLASPLITTTYYITVTSANGCMATDTITITVDLQCAGMYIPSAFSPNNDGQNDVFSVKGNCFSSLFLVIYDRWGEKVYETNDPAFEWTGIYKSQLLHSDVFIYQLNGTLYSGETIYFTGHINLLR